MGLSTPSTSSSELESLSASSGDEKKQQDSDGKWKQSRLSVSASSSMEDLEEMEQSGIDEEGGICTDVTSSGDVSHVPFEVLEQLRSTGERSTRTRKPKKLKRLNKNRPSEMSSKRPVSSFKQVLEEGSNRVHKDPRFESLCGDYNLSRFREQYSFLYDEVMPGEAQTIKKQIKKTKSQDRKQNLRNELKKVELQIKEEVERKKQQQHTREFKAKELEAVKGGKRPYYLSKRKKREVELLNKFKELQKNGKLDKYMEKMRKRKAAKEHKLVPSKRRS